MKFNKIKVIAMDLDGTLTQHKQPLSAEYKKILAELSKKYTLLMVGAGQVMRIFNQMERFPIDIIGNYGLQYGKYDTKAEEMRLVRNLSFDVDKAEIEKRVSALRKKHGFEDFSGENVEYHPSGCLTFPILGTAAKQEDKLAFDPGRKKRRAIYREVVAAFPEYSVFVGGSSSFDMAPKPYDKYYALKLYCEENGLLHENVIYIGDDYGMGGNDEAVFKSDFPCLEIDNYKDFRKIISVLL